MRLVEVNKEEGNGCDQDFGIEGCHLGRKEAMIDLRRKGGVEKI